MNLQGIRVNIQHTSGKCRHSQAANVGIRNTPPGSLLDVGNAGTNSRHDTAVNSRTRSGAGLWT